jgi:hypothetical protein
MELTWKVNGFGDESGRAVHVTASAVAGTREQANEIAKTFPKSLGVKASTLGGVFDGKFEARGYLTVDALLSKNGTNGGVNESGLKRIRSFLRRVEWRYEMTSGNALTEQAFREQVLAD